MSYAVEMIRRACYGPVKEVGYGQANRVGLIYGSMAANWFYFLKQEGKAGVFSILVPVSTPNNQILILCPALI